MCRAKLILFFSVAKLLSLDTRVVLRQAGKDYHVLHAPLLRVGELGQESPGCTEGEIENGAACLLRAPHVATHTA
jgi:hypothetical protein